MFSGYRIYFGIKFDAMFENVVEYLDNNYPETLLTINESFRDYRNKFMGVRRFRRNIENKILQWKATNQSVNEENISISQKPIVIGNDFIYLSTSKSSAILTPESQGTYHLRTQERDMAIELFHKAIGKSNWQFVLHDEIFSCEYNC